MSDTTEFLKIARFVANEEESSRLVKRLGFPDGGEIERFLRKSYGTAVAQMNYADRLKGHMFVLEPSISESQLAEPAKLIAALQRIKAQEQDSVLAVTLDLGNDETVIARPSMADLANKVGGAWGNSHAKELSESLDKCVVIATGFQVTVFISGQWGFEIADVREGLSKGPQEDFQKLSWDNGEILYFFAEHELNDRSDIGIWRLPDKFILRSNPETLIELRLDWFLRHRLIGMVTLERESYVENEGRLDLALQLANGFVNIIEIKWMGRSLQKKQKTKSDAEIESALKNGDNWFTDFDESDALDPGLKQVVIYCASGRFHKGYLAVFDCQSPDRSKTDKNISITATAGQDPAKFRIIRAAVDPRSASVKSKD